MDGKDNAQNFDVEFKRAFIIKFNTMVKLNRDIEIEKNKKYFA